VPPNERVEKKAHQGTVKREEKSKRNSTPNRDLKRYGGLAATMECQGGNPDGEIYFQVAFLQTERRGFEPRLR